MRVLINCCCRYILNWNVTLVYVLIFGTSFGYILVCLTCKQKTQLFIAKLLTAGYAIIMALVVM